MPVGNEPNHVLNGLQVDGGLSVANPSGQKAFLAADGYGNLSSNDDVMVSAPVRVAATILSRTRTFFGGAANESSTLASGHGWTTSGGDGTTDLNFTGDAQAPNGAQCIKLVSGGAGAAAVVTSPRIATPVSMVGKTLVLLLKVDSTNYSALQSLSVYVGGGVSAFTNFSSQQVLGYFGSGADYGEMAQPGEWFAVSVPPASFTGTTGGTPDFTQIKDVRVRIQDTGVGSKATVYVGGAWFAQQDTTTYPNGVVSICFDDLFSSVYTAALPKMQQYGYRGSIFAITDTLGTSGYMTSDQLAALVANGWDVGGHAYAKATHNLSDSFAGLSRGQVAQDFASMRAWMKNLGYRGQNVLAFPQGKFDTTVEAEARRQWSAARTICNRTVESVPPADPYRIKSYAPGSTAPFTPNGTVGTLEWYVDQIVTYGGWFVLTFHKVVSSIGSQPTLEVTTANFNTLIDYIATKGVAVKTVAEVLGV